MESGVLDACRCFVFWNPLRPSLLRLVCKMFQAVFTFEERPSPIDLLQVLANGLDGGASIYLFVQHVQNLCCSSRSVCPAVCELPRLVHHG